VSGAEANDATRATVSRLRGGLLVIAALIVVGTALELAFREHWTQSVQLVAWASLAVLAVAIGLAWRGEDGRSARVARALALLVCAAAVFGVIEHVVGNYDAGPLDALYGEQWDTMSEAARWWASFRQAVGPSPALAPGVLVLAALCVWFATPRRGDLER